MRGPEAPSASLWTSLCRGVRLPLLIAMLLLGNITDAAAQSQPLNIEFYTVPNEGKSVFLNGREIGVTPFKTSIAPGTHRITIGDLLLPDYEETVEFRTHETAYKFDLGTKTYATQPTVARSKAEDEAGKEIDRYLTEKDFVGARETLAALPRIVSEERKTELRKLIDETESNFQQAVLARIDALSSANRFAEARRYLSEHREYLTEQQATRAQLEVNAKARDYAVAKVEDKIRAIAPHLNLEKAQDELRSARIELSRFRADLMPSDISRLENVIADKSNEIDELIAEKRRESIKTFSENIHLKIFVSTGLNDMRLRGFKRGLHSYYNPNVGIEIGYKNMLYVGYAETRGRLETEYVTRRTDGGTDYYDVGDGFLNRRILYAYYMLGFDKRNRKAGGIKFGLGAAEYRYQYRLQYALTTNGADKESHSLEGGGTTTHPFILIGGDANYGYFYLTFLNTYLVISSFDGETEGTPSVELIGVGLHF